MSPSPDAHVLLKDVFIYYDRGQVFLAGGEARSLERADRAVIECLQRGESEIGVLCRRLNELEIGGAPVEIAEQLVATMADADSILELRPPIDVIEPEVIVCSHSPDCRHFDSRKLVQRLRRRFRVLHIALEERVRGDPRQNVSYEALKKAKQFRSTFQFHQWVRSLIRFHSSAVLVLAGAHDAVLFGDLAASHRSVLVLNPSWPPAISVEDLLGARGSLRDPLPALQTLFYALRFAVGDDLVRVTHSSASDYGRLELYGVRNASVVACTRADQAHELECLRPNATNDVPLFVRASRESPAADAPYVALLLDLENAEPVGSFLGALRTALQAIPRIQRLALVSHTGWKTLDFRPDRIALTPWSGPTPRPRDIAAAILFPGLVRYLFPALELMAHDVPVVMVPSAEPHPLQVDADDALILRERTVAELTLALGEIVDSTSPRNREIRGACRKMTARWDLTRVIDRLARVPAENARPTASMP